MSSPLISFQNMLDPAQGSSADEGWKAALLCTQLGKFKASLQVAKQVQQLNDGQATQYRNHVIHTIKLAAEFSEEIADYQQAAEYWNKSVQLSPQDAIAWHGLGIAKANLQDYHGALQALHQALRYDPNNLKLKLSLSEVQQCLA